MCVLTPAALSACVWCSDFQEAKLVIRTFFFAPSLYVCMSSSRVTLHYLFMHVMCHYNLIWWKMFCVQSRCLIWMCLQTTQRTYSLLKHSKRLKVTNTHFVCFLHDPFSKESVHLSITPLKIFVPFPIPSSLPLSISLLWLMRTLSTGSHDSPLSFFQQRWLKFTILQSAA